MKNLILLVISFSLTLYLCNICEVSAQIRKNTTETKNNSQVILSADKNQSYQLLKMLDRNNDNVISLTEIKNIQKVFSALDLNRDEKLSINEYGPKPNPKRPISLNTDNTKNNSVSNNRLSNRRPSVREAISASRNSASNSATARSTRSIRKASGSLSNSIKRPTSRLSAKKPEKVSVNSEPSTTPKNRSIGKKSVNLNAQNNKEIADSNVEVVLKLETRLKGLVESARTKYKDISNASDKQKVRNFMRRDSRKYLMEIKALKSKPDSQKVADIMEQIKEFETILN